MNDGGGRIGRRLHGIQYLRALAALGVVVVHATDRLPIFGLGVELFFMLSGFMMVAITDETSRAGRFLLHRVIRIVPLYWLVTAAMLAFQWIVYPSSPLVDPGYVAASLFFIPVVAPGDGRILPLVMQGWTLNFEMLFYLLFAAALLLPRRLQMLAVSASILALAAVGLFLQPEHAALYTWTSPFVLEFLAGVWAGALWKRGAPLWPLLPAAVGVALLCLFLPAPMQIARVAGGCIVFALLVGTLIAERRPGGVRAWRLPMLLGDASYSIYLWQGFAVLAAHFVGSRFGFSPVAQGTLFCVLAVPGGVAAYLLVERPMLRFARRVRGDAKPRPIEI